MLRKFLLLLSFTIHVCVVRAFGPISTTLVDRNTNFATRHHGIIHVEESSSSSSSPRCRRGFSFPLFMAKPKTTTPTTPQSDEAAAVPANLKRKVEAKRPPLGHVIPKDTREKGSGGSANPRLRPQGKARSAGLNNPSNLKIFGGTARGRRLDSPSVYLRPMMGKVREAVYSTLTSFGLYDEKYPIRHLDLFSGSGSVGLESLSRGAGHCTFCDLSPDCCAAVERNIEWCQFNTEDYTTQVVCSDVLQLLRNPYGVGVPQGDTFGIITICPPYEEVVYADLLSAVASSPIIREDTIVLVEYPVELWGEIPHVFQGDATTTSDDNDNATSGGGATLVGIRNRKYGRTVIAMYICNPTGRIENAESRPEEFI